MLNKRIHTLDNLRAHLMLLGVIFHCALSYVDVPENLNYWYYQDQDTSIIFNLITYIIHLFRMPLFFFVAGFFAALLIRKTGGLGLLKNRLKRLGIPLIVFFPLLFLFCKAIFSSFDSLRPEMTEQFILFPASLRDLDLIHLWFLLYLILCVVLLCVCKAISNHSSFLEKRSDWIHTKLWNGIGIIVWPLLTTAIITMYGDIQIKSQIKPLESIELFLFYLLFFFAGYSYYKSNLVKITPRRIWPLWLSSITLFIVANIAMQANSITAESSTASFMLNAFLLSSFIWIFCFSIFNTYKKYANKSSPTLKYVSNASYWIYLIHFPLTIAFPVILQDSSMHLALKFTLSVLGTYFVAFISYEFFVKNTFMGVLLNGRKNITIQQKNS